MRYISLFSGVECASLAARGLGWTPVCFSEIDPFASAVLQHRFPDVPNVGDVTAVDWGRYRGAADLVCGGSPCQAFSVAGKRGSLGDARGNLTLAFVEACNDIDPEWIVWENVPGILNTRDNAFGCFLGALVGHDAPLDPSGKRWTCAGVVSGSQREVAWRVLDAQFFGVPQRRRRVVLLAGRTGTRPYPAEILFELASSGGDHPPRRKAGEAVARALGGGSGSRGYANSVDICGAFTPEVVPAVTAKWSNGYGGPAGDECQNIVVTHRLRGESFDAGEDGTGRGTPLVSGTVPQRMGTDGADDNDAARGMYVAAPVAFQEAQTGVREYPTAGTLRADGPGHDSVGTRIREGLAVRRLTPRECERLQGMPDDWTLVPYRGRPACDGPRYRAIGNGWAVPVFAWLFGRLERGTK